MALETILEKWEEQSARVLAEDTATVDLGDFQAALIVKQIISEIREDAKNASK